MGFLKEVGKALYSPWDDSKITCRHVGKGNPPPCANSDVAVDYFSKSRGSGSSGSGSPIWSSLASGCSGLIR